MVPNSGSLTRRSPLVYRFITSSFTPLAHFGKRTQVSLNRVQLTGFRACSSCSSCSFPLNSSHRAFPEDFSSFKFGWQLNFNRFCASAVSNGGSGGAGGGGLGGSGNGDSGGGGKSDDHFGGNNRSFVSWYLTLLAKYPVMTKALTSALLTFIGDLICQLVIDQAPSLDLKRSFLFTFLGFVMVGPTLHFWYLYLSRVVKLGGASGAFLRLLLDQFIFSPIFIGVFLSTLVTLEGRPEQVVPKLQQEWFSAVLANWQLWIPFQFLNFRFVPQQFQVLAANAIALVWNVILSFKAHKEVLSK